MNFIKKLLFTCIGLVAITSAHAYQDNCEPCPPEPVCCDQPTAPKTSAYNHPGKIDVCGSWDVYVTGSFIYWQAIEKELAIGIWDPANINVHTEDIIYLDYEYKPGFKVGLGYNFDYDDWNAYVEYTRLHLTDSSTSKRPSWATILGTFWNAQTANQTPDEIKGRWKLDYDMLDLEFARSGYVGKKLVLKPFGGLRGGWIDQKITVTVINPNDPLLVENIATSSSDSWLIGLRTGTYCDWMLGEGFSFLGKAAGSILYQRFSNLRFIQPSTNSSPIVLQSNIDAGSLPSATAIFELMAGLNWGTYFDNNNWYFDLFAGYEFNYLLSQNMMAHIRGVQSHPHNSPPDLALHGLTVSARLDF